MRTDKNHFAYRVERPHTVGADGLPPVCRDPQLGGLVRLLQAARPDHLTPYRSPGLDESLNRAGKSHDYEQHICQPGGRAGAQGHRHKATGTSRFLPFTVLEPQGSNPSSQPVYSVLCSMFGLAGWPAVSHRRVSKVLCREAQGAGSFCCCRRRGEGAELGGGLFGK